MNTTPAAHWSADDRRLLTHFPVSKVKPWSLRKLITARGTPIKNPVSRGQLEVTLGKAISAGIIEQVPKGFVTSTAHAEAMTRYYESEEFDTYKREWLEQEDGALEADDYYDGRPEDDAWREQLELWVPDPAACLSIEPEDYRAAVRAARWRFVALLPVWIAAVPLIAGLLVVLLMGAVFASVASVGYWLWEKFTPGRTAPG